MYITGMDPFQIRQALLEVRHLRRNILEKQLFKGYSGRARAIGGTIALGAGMAGQYWTGETQPERIFILWGTVFILAVLVNYGAVVTWLMRTGNRNRTDISFILEVMPVWIVGGVLTLTLWTRGQEDLLYGCWMCLFGLAQSIGRSRMPRQMAWIGLFYLICGTACLTFADGIFARPVLMGLVFFVGEVGSGFIMHTSDREGGLAGYFKWGKL